MFDQKLNDLALIRILLILVTKERDEEQARLPVAVATLDIWTSAVA